MDYYSSTVPSLRCLLWEPSCYLPTVDIYVDDISFEGHNDWCGELLAIEEFNAVDGRRKIARHTMLREKRLFKNAKWIDHMFTLHVLDHSARQPQMAASVQRVLDNPYLGQIEGGLARSAHLGVDDGSR